MMPRLPVAARPISAMQAAPTRPVAAGPSPMTAAPAPVAAMPAAVTAAPAAVTAVAPANFLRFEVIDFVAGGDGGMSIRLSLFAERRSRVIVQRMRRQRRGLGTGAEHCRARGDAQGKPEKVPALHDTFPPVDRRMMRRD